MGCVPDSDLYVGFFASELMLILLSQPPSPLIAIKITFPLRDLDPNSHSQAVESTQEQLGS